jgi:hypothetical protein
MEAGGVENPALLLLGMLLSEDLRFPPAAAAAPDPDTPAALARPPADVSEVVLSADALRAPPAAAAAAVPARPPADLSEVGLSAEALRLLAPPAAAVAMPALLLPLAVPLPTCC